MLTDIYVYKIPYIGKHVSTIMRNLFYVSLSHYFYFFFPLFILLAPARRDETRVNDIVRDFGTWKILFSIAECAENRTNRAEDRLRHTGQTIACIFVAPMAKEGEKGDVGVNTINARACNITRVHAWYL